MVSSTPPHLFSLSIPHAHAHPNLPAQLLDSNARLCTTTLAILPSSHLLKLHAIRDPRPPHTNTLVPLDLFERATNPRKKLSSGSPPPSRSRATSTTLNRESFATQFLSQVGRNAPSIPANLPALVDDLMRSAVVRRMSWPIVHRSSDFVVMPDAAGGEVPAPLPGSAALLYIGGRVRSEQVDGMEVKVRERFRAIEKVLLKFILSPLPSWVKPAALLTDARGLWPPVEVMTVEALAEVEGVGAADVEVSGGPGKLQEVGEEEVVSEGSGSVAADAGWIPPSCNIPVISMVDIIGEEKTRELFKHKRFDGASWVCVKNSKLTSTCITPMIQAAWWFSEASS
jgi:hypothetical protein